MRVFCVSCCDFKGVWVLPETAELTRLVTTSSPVDAHTRAYAPEPLHPAPRSDGRCSRRPSQPPIVSERSIVSLPCVSDQRSRHVFPRHGDRDASEAAAQREERGWLCVLFRPRAQLVLAGAVRSCMFARVCVCMDVVP